MGDQSVFQGQNVNLNCNGYGVPHPTLTWYLDGEQLKASSRITVQREQLNIFNATITDGGNYTCVVQNLVGKVSCAVFLKIRGGNNVINTVI